MFIKYLDITQGTNIIRHISFNKGLNLIVDNTGKQVTGNNVGKTTVLKLIDYCLGAHAKEIWTDPEHHSQSYESVKDFLTKQEILITLCLVEDIDDDNSNSVIIERNFLTKAKKVIRRINGKHYSDEADFKRNGLKEIFFPEHQAEKPTFRQIISHNIRYKNLSIENTLKTLDPYTSDQEYESLYLFLFDCDFSHGDARQEILEQIKQENRFKSRLEKERPKSQYERMLSLIEHDINILEEKKLKLNINPDYERDLNQLNSIKYQINRMSSDISKLQIRKDLILEAKEDLDSGRAEIDTNQLKGIYEQAKAYNDGLQKTFEDLVEYHNKMLSEKVSYITKDLPKIESEIKEKNTILAELLVRESELTTNITKSDTFEELEILIGEINEKYRQKGEYESTIAKLNEVESNINNYNEDLKSIDEELFSEDFESLLKLKIDKFNRHFASVSNALYQEKYALDYEIKENKDGTRVYKFITFAPDPNIASGKKQGEIASFDIAYIFFADEENIPCFHFLLNDKKELMHDNQLIEIAHLIDNRNIQFVASILKDKLPPELNDPKYFIIELSQDDKLFRIENN